MRNLLSNLMLVALLAGVFVFAGCNKDKTAPELTLEGDNPMAIALYSTYVEPGFTANDDIDGNITVNVEVTGEVNEDAIGSYTLTYTISDERGNTTILDRVVNVVMRENYLGSWAVGEGADCPITWTSGDNQTVAAGATENEIAFNTFYGTFGGVLTATVSGQSLTIPPQNVNGAGEVTGTGTINNTATSIVLSLNRAAFLGDETCTLTYTK